MLLFFAPRTADAGCMTLDQETTPGTFETIYVCRNTLSEPVYTIVQHYAGDGSILVFNFDPTGANIVCTDYELANIKNAKCRKAGLRPIKPTFTFKKNIVKVERLLNFGDAERKALYTNSTVFSYPEAAEDIEFEKCFVHIAKNHLVTFGYDDKNYMALSTCLIQIEVFFKENKKIMLDILWGK